jgi:hypothetical protein
MGTFGRVEIAVTRARLDSAAGKTTEWKSSALQAYQRRTKEGLNKGRGMDEGRSDLLAGDGMG